MWEKDARDQNKNNYTIKHMEVMVPMDEFRRDCVDVPKFQGLCAECFSYGTRWSCPPFDFDPMDIWNKYDRFDMLAWILYPGQGMTGREARSALAREKDVFLEVLLAAEKKDPGSLAISAGTCTLCGKVCARSLGLPCRQPEKLRYSIESLGGNVAMTVERYLGLKLLWEKDGVAPEHLVLVGGLLQKGERK